MNEVNINLLSLFDPGLCRDGEYVGIVILIAVCIALPVLKQEGPLIERILVGEVSSFDYLLLSCVEYVR
jgi:hypothetical protein